ncbi:DUF1292 domain-containing protein [Tumebacillus sp. ITR2]|uniref:DUF1292 domain-containing protein n=1 Tax=Tumebacillus amylolyticus TaxID=2801339 RepID=A0ABS1JDA8_9BACL|nr:DUF1292 domain-containing protein [Tumebacillus amylolyticus]MBL0388190.1 DUF1292 domain-containing protein [Tumebacillus amylolyticus]
MSENNNDVHIHDENCDHDHEEVVTLTDAEGVEREFIIVEEMNVENDRYAILVPADGEDEDGVIMKIGQDENGEYLVDIEDDEEWKKVVAAYEKLTDEA